MKDWENYKSDWYTAIITIKSEKQFEELMIWIDKNIEAHRKHTIWSLTRNNMFTIRFRYERDYEWFVLTWV
jgi:hypothetical protein